jgi:uncharacterized iron-regulated membrane protein
VRRTPFGFALAVFVGVMAGMFLQPSIGPWAILVGVAVAMAIDWWLRRRNRLGPGDGSAPRERREDDRRR